MQNYFTSEGLVPIVKHFVLDNVPTMKDNTAILDGLLWSCHPKVLLTYSNSKDNEFIKVSENFLTRSKLLLCKIEKFCLLIILFMFFPIFYLFCIAVPISDTS